MKRIISITCFLMMLFIFQTSEGSGQNFPVTIQGSLKDGSAPANGSYDIKCAFYWVESGGAFVANFTFTSIPVTNGIFTIKLANANITFADPLTALWAEYSVRPAGSAVAYTTLSPRQRVSFAPFAITAYGASTLGGTLASEFVQTSDPRMSDARNPIPGSASYIQNGQTAQTGNFNISGTGSATVLNATQFNLGGIKMLSNGGLLDNLFLGLGAGQSTTGPANAFFGTNAGRDNTSGLGNAFFGWQTGRSNTTGIDNSFFGASPGASNTTGNNNSFFGRQSGALNTTGNNNSAFGYYSLFNNTIGANNSTLGFDAGRSITTGSRNTFVGTSSGPSSTTESNNTLLGNQTDVSAGITNATAIGNQAKVAQSNSLVLGSINGVNGATADTNVGIGTTTPANKLHVNGTIRVTNGAVYITNPNTVIITSPNGACWGITVNNSGALATFPIAVCP